MSAQIEFGTQVQNEVQKLKKLGKDPNQIAGIICNKDQNGRNYGIGIILDGNGKPWQSSSTLLNFLEQETKNSGAGNYKNSAAVMDQLTNAVLSWQQIPETYHANFKLFLPSDAGTGAVQTAIQAVTLLKPTAKALSVEALGWPAYKAIAKSARLDFREDGEGDVVLYQAGPLNTTGQIEPKETIQMRAKAAAKNGTVVILDRAYSGFEYAKALGKKSYAEVMQASFEHHIKPYLDEGVSVLLALSPTKAFVTFALRPCGLLLAFSPDKSKREKLTATLNTLMRARGSSFEHTVTRAFVNAFIQNKPGLEREHEGALKRLQESENQWATLVKGTSMEPLFSSAYAGLFRNPKAKDEAAIYIYNNHLYPVFSNGRCRLNVTGLPSDQTLAQAHVKIFSDYCYQG